MKVTFNFDDEGFKKLQRKAKELHGERELPLSELLTDDFIRQHTDFQTLQEILDASGVKSAEEIKSEEFSKFVATHTQFSGWEEMLTAAAAGYYKRQLGF